MDWATQFASIKVCVLANDGRALVDHLLLQLPANGANPALTISRDPVTEAELLRCWRWLSLVTLQLTTQAAPEVRLSSARSPEATRVWLLLTLREGSGVAAIHTQPNFDPQLLTFRETAPGGLGSLFDLSAKVTDGRLLLTFARAEPLVSGQGILARLAFDIILRAGIGMASDVAAADLMVVNVAGTRLGNDEGPLQALSGHVEVSPLLQNEGVDLDEDELADGWEDTHGLSLEMPSASGDPHQDGIVNLLEYAFGTDPHVENCEFRPPSEVVEVGGQ